MGKRLHKGYDLDRNLLLLILKAVILVLGFITLIILCATTLFNREYITPYFENSIIRNNGIRFVLITIIGIIIFIIGCSFLKKSKPRQVFLFFAITFFISGIYLVFNASTQLNWADPLFVYKIANQMNHGNFKSLLPFYSTVPGQGYNGYLAVYPFQLGCITYLRLLESFSSNIRFLYFTNVLLVILINLILYKITKLITKDNTVAQNWTIILSFLFLPMLFFTLFIYGNVPGLCACLAAVYFGLKLIVNSSKSRFSWLWCILCFTLAYQLKSNYQIAVIALGIVFILYAIRNRKYVLILMPFAILIFMYGSNKVIEKAYELESGYTIQKGMPMSAYIAMGLQSDNSEKRGPGWYDGYSVNLYEKEKSNSRKTAQAAKKEIKNEVRYYRKNPDKAHKFFKDKFISTWADPTFQSVWIAPWGQKPNTRVLDNIYYSNYNYLLCKNSKKQCWYQKSMKYVSVWCNFMVVLILVFSIGFLLCKRLEVNYYAIFSILNLMGGMAFHLFWETKSQYVIQYIFCLIPVAAMFLGEIAERKNKKMGILIKKKN